MCNMCKFTQFTHLYTPPPPQALGGGREQQNRRFSKNFFLKKHSLHSLLKKKFFELFHCVQLCINFSHTLKKINT